jgi:2-polyprenyl-3-methyl-5-hydroxy-6-metoxy-1,4-benzoquinol methylase
MASREHWEEIYRRKASDEVSWYRPHLERSVGFIESAGLATDGAVIDVGGGTSTLVDDLLARGNRNLTVLDLSSNAIGVAKSRLGARSSEVSWIRR